MTADAPARVSAIDVRRAVAELANSGTYMSLAMWGSVSERLLAGADALEDLRDSRALTQAQAERIAALEAEVARLTTLLHSMSAAIDDARRHGKDADAAYLDMVADRDSWAEQDRETTKLGVEYLNRAEAAESSLAETRAKVEGALRFYADPWNYAFKYHSGESHLDTPVMKYDLSGNRARLALDALAALPEAKPAAQADDAAPEVKP